MTHQRKFTKSCLNIEILKYWKHDKKIKNFFLELDNNKIKIFKKLHLRNYLNDHISVI